MRYRINPDEAVAIGAALITHNLAEFGSDIENNVSIQNKTVRKIFTAASITKLINAR